MIRGRGVVVASTSLDQALGCFHIDADGFLWAAGLGRLSDPDQKWRLVHSPCCTRSARNRANVRMICDGVSFWLVSGQYLDMNRSFRNLPLRRRTNRVQNRNRPPGPISQMSKLFLEALSLVTGNLLIIHVLLGGRQTILVRQLEQRPPREAVPLQTQHGLLIERRRPSVTLKH